MNDLDKWSAVACGVIYGDLTHQEGYWTKGYWTKGSVRVNEYWTLSDPRCMQVFREKLRIATEESVINLGEWDAIYKNGDLFVTGKTIQEAELACAQAIMEKDDE